MEVTHMNYIYFELSQLCTQLSYATTQTRPAKNSGLNGIRTYDLCDAGAVLYQLSYQANWELVIIRNSLYTLRRDVREYKIHIFGRRVRESINERKSQLCTQLQSLEKKKA